MEYIKIEQLEVILLIGALVAILARRLHIPYTAGLVAAGIAITFLPVKIDAPLSKEILFKVLLPPLIFEAALYINWRELRQDLVPIATFATLGVVMSAGITAAIMHFAIGWTWAASILLGVLIAATDPVSVIATFKEARVEGRLRLLVEAESLFNDSTAAVAFVVALAFAAAEPVGFGSAALMMATSIVGGVAAGLLVGGGVLLIVWKTTDHLAELALTTIAAFGSFWLAEHFHMSGVLASMTAGLLIGNTTSFGFISSKGEDSIESFWEFAAFVANSIVFVLLGIYEGYQNFGPVLTTIGIAIIAVIIARAVAIYPISAAFARTRWKIDPRHQHILFWGGLRGALALALALSIPESFAYRQQIVLVTFGVVAFSVFVQGLTITPLLKLLGQLPAAEEEPETV